LQGKNKEAVDLSLKYINKKEIIKMLILATKKRRKP
jgi:hypothetical protein